MDSPLNNRGPGRTCLAACTKLAEGKPWLQATVPHSKGCGTVMRVAPVALVPGLSLPERSALAQYQAVVTHAHPSALACADVGMYAIYLLRHGETPAGLLARLRDYAAAQRTVYHHDWLGGVWQRFAAEGNDLAAQRTLFGTSFKTVRQGADPARITSGADYIAYGWDEMGAVLDKLEEALGRGGTQRDVADAVGEGWAGDQAVGAALYAFLRHRDDPVEAVRYAARSRGDSDSIASITGALCGACYGITAWPERWTRRVESRDLLRAFGSLWEEGRQQ
jgi:ADP-ribosylglycohydrolase